MFVKKTVAMRASPHSIALNILFGTLALHLATVPNAKADNLYNPSGAAFIDVQDPSSLIQLPGSRVQLSGKVTFIKGDSEVTGDSLSKLKVRAFFPDRTNEVTADINLYPNNLSFSYLTPPLQNTLSNALIVRVGEISPAVDQAEILQAKIQKYLAFIQQLLRDHKSKGASQEELKKIEALSSPLGALNKRLTGWIGKRSEAFAERVYPIYMDGAPSVPSYYQSNIGHYKLVISLAPGALIEGESAQGTASVTNTDTQNEPASGKGKGSDKSDNKDPLTVQFSWKGEVLKKLGPASIAAGDAVSYDLTVPKVLSANPSTFEIQVKDRSGDGPNHVVNLALKEVVIPDNVPPTWSNLQQSPFARSAQLINTTISDTLGKVDPSSIHGTLTGTKDSGASVQTDITSSLQIATSDQGASYQVSGDVNPLDEGTYEISLGHYVKPI